jgi:LmbE family N-acetylglucosaminyl deacetylase
VTNGSVIVFAPHPDDETLGCGGTIAKRISEGYEVTVVVMTDGRFALKSEGVLSDPSPEEMKSIRKSEVQNASKTLGVKEQNLLCMDFEDSSLEANKDSAEAKVLDILEEKHPIEVYFTYSKDTNLDHRATNKIVHSAIAKLGVRVTKWEYSIVQPYAVIDSLKDSFLNLFTHNMLYVDISRFLDLKKAAFAEYRSQVSIISSKQKRTVIKSRLINMHMKNYEPFYKA